MYLLVITQSPQVIETTGIDLDECELCGYGPDECGCYDCACGRNVVLLNSVECEGDA